MTVRCSWRLFVVTNQVYELIQNLCLRGIHTPQRDIQMLLQLPYVDIADFERLAREAISYYVGDETRILGNLKVVLDDYHHGEEGRNGCSYT